MRPTVMDDLKSVVELLNTRAHMLTGASQYSEQETLVEWSEPDWDVSEDSRIVIAPDGDVAAWLECYDPPPHVRKSFWVYLHPEHEGRGFENALLGWARRWAIARLDLAPEGSRVVMNSSYYSNDAASRSICEAAGMTAERHHYQMGIEMDGEPPSPQIPEGIIIRPIIAGKEEQDAVRVFDEAFKDHWGHVDRPFTETWKLWKHRIEADETYDPALWFLAMDGNTLAGVSICWTHIGEQTDTGWIGTLGVLRDHRRRGIGEALLCHSFRAFWERGKRKVGLTVDADSLTGATRLYEKCGMHIQHRIDVYTVELRAGDELRTQSIE